jgi:hypothetical protein
MSSYHSSFSYNGENSAKDRNLIIASFEPDNGFKETFLSVDVIQEDYYDGTKKYTYGSKYNTTSTISITVIKGNGGDFSLNEVRSHLKWLTGARVDSWLDMYSGDKFQYSFLGRVTDVQQQKLDARTIGLMITFTSISPWAYSAPQSFNCNIWQSIDITSDGAIHKDEQDSDGFGLDNNGVLTVSALDNDAYFNITEDGTVYMDTAYRSIINNQSDDLYTYIYLDIDYQNDNGTYISIKNNSLQEESLISNVSANESIQISAKQFILSSIPNKSFGDDFNFVWPRLQPGANDFVIEGDGGGTAKFTYRYPMKVGDCTMDVSTYGADAICGDCSEIPSYDTIRWEDITGTPNTIGGYGITDAYTDKEIDDKLKNIDISGGGGSGSGSATIDEEELNNMLEDILT